MSKHLQHVANLKTMVEVKRLSSSSSSSTSNLTSLLPVKVIDEDNYEDKMQVDRIPSFLSEFNVFLSI